MEIFATGLPLYLKLKQDFPKNDEKIDTDQCNDTKLPERFIKKRASIFARSLVVSRLGTIRSISFPRCPMT